MKTYDNIRAMYNEMDTDNEPMFQTGNMVKFAEDNKRHKILDTNYGIGGSSEYRIKYQNEYIWINEDEIISDKPMKGN
jgi:hypothetical protein